jgi:membrane protease YdiL (CAAX protease family)
MLCPQCGGEYREGFALCADCGVALVEGPVEEPEDAATATVQREQSLRIAELGMLLFAGFGSSLIISLHHAWHGVRHVAASSGGGGGGDPMLRGLSDIIQSLPALCLLLYVLSRQRRSLRDITGTPRWSDFTVALGLVLLRHLPNIFFFLTAVRHGVMSRSFPVFRPEALGTLTIAGLLFAAAQEELIVRAYMMSEILSLTGNAFLAVAASTCFQALYHLYQGPRGMIYVAWSFLLYSLYYWKTRRATPVVLAHCMMNLWISLRFPF